nr:unnamed protein product [Digitaria exilis]
MPIVSKQTMARRALPLVPLSVEGTAQDTQQCQDQGSQIRGNRGRKIASSGATAARARLPLRYDRRPGSRLRGSRLPTPANRSGFSGNRSVAAVSRPTAGEVVHCDKVSKEVCEYFQRELERAKKLTAQRAQEKLRKEKAAAEGNCPGGGEAYDEEAELQRALNQSRAEEEFRRGVQQRGGAYGHGGGSGTRGEGTLQRMLRRATSARQTPGVTDYNLGSARGSTQPRIDTGSWTQKDEDDDEGDMPLPSNIVADKINPADLRKRKYHIAPSKVIPKRQRGQATGKGKHKEIEVLSDEDTDDAMMVVAVVAAVAVLLAVAGAEACHLQTHLLDIDHGAPMSQRRTVGPTDYGSPQFSSSSSYRESSHPVNRYPRAVVTGPGSVCETLARTGRRDTHSTLALASLHPALLPPPRAERARGRGEEKNNCGPRIGRRTTSPSPATPLPTARLPRPILPRRRRRSAAIPAAPLRRARSGPHAPRLQIRRLT